MKSPSKKLKKSKNPWNYNYISGEGEYIYTGNTEAVFRTVELAPGLLLDLDKNNEVFGIEILNRRK